MPAQHGPTYDPDEEPPPRGGWFAFVERPFPEKVDRVSRWVSGALAIAITAFGSGVILYAAAETRNVNGIVPAALMIGVAAALAYGFTRGIGMILVAIYSTARDGSEFVIDWRALRHDLPLRRVQVLLAGAALLLAAAGGSLWGFVLFVRDGLVYGLAACILIQTMTWWPYIRRWRLTGQAD